MNFDEHFKHENDFYISAPVSRFSKFITHLDLFRKISDLRGEIVECGVFKGNSLMRWVKFRSLLENPFSRKIIAFDTFDEFPDASYEAEDIIRKKFIKEAGSKSVTQESLNDYLNKLKLNQNIFLVKGNILKTAPEYSKSHLELRIALLHIDVDLYEPTKVTLESFFSHVVKGGVVILDDYGSFPGANKAIENHFKGTNYEIKQLNYSNAISYIIKT